MMGDWTIRSALSGNPCLCNPRPTPTAEGFFAGLGCHRHTSYEYPNDCVNPCGCKLEAVEMQEGFFFHKMRCASDEPVLIPWWLGDGSILPAECAAAYQAKGAASYLDSLTNLANPGTFTLSADIYDYDPAPLDGTPAWNAVDGWILDGNDGYYEFDGLDTGMTMLDIGKEGSIIAFFSDAQVTEDEWRYLTGNYIRRDYGMTHSANEMVVGFDDQNNALYIYNGSSAGGIPSYNQFESPLGFSGRYRYYNGALDTLLPMGEWEETIWELAGGVPIMIGCYAGNDYYEDGTPYYHPYYCGNAYTGKIQAIAFYSTALTEAQLNAIAAAAIAQGAA